MKCTYVYARFVIGFSLFLSLFLPYTLNLGTPWANYSINGISRKSKNTGKNIVSDKCVSVPKILLSDGLHVAQTLQGLGDFLKFIQMVFVSQTFHQKIQ